MFLPYHWFYMYEYISVGSAVRRLPKVQEKSICSLLFFRIYSILKLKTTYHVNRSRGTKNNSTVDSLLQICSWTTGGTKEHQRFTYVLISCANLPQIISCAFCMGNYMDRQTYNYRRTYFFDYKISFHFFYRYHDHYYHCY